MSFSNTFIEVLFDDNSRVNYRHKDQLWQVWLCIIADLFKLQSPFYLSNTLRYMNDIIFKIYTYTVTFYYVELLALFLNRSCHILYVQIVTNWINDINCIMAYMWFYKVSGITFAWTINRKIKISHFKSFKKKTYRLAAILYDMIFYFWIS